LKQNQTINTMPPMSGTKNNKSHQPVRPVSCSLRTATAMLGRNMARPQSAPTGAVTEPAAASIARSIMAAAMSASIANKFQNQNSERAARPANFA
jgi:hypothetical protein